MTTRQRYVTARIAYVAVILLATLASLDFSPDLDEAALRLARAFAPSLTWRDAIDGLRNVVLFAGLGGVWIVTSLSGKIARELRTATIVSFVLSVTVEGLQVFSPVRDASIFDVATNTAGGFAGAAAMTLVLISLRKSRGERSYVGIPTLLIAGPYLAATVAEMFAPLFESDPMRLPGGGPLDRLSIALQFSVPLDWTEIPVIDFPLFVAAGALAVALVRERRGTGRMQWVAVSVVGALVALIAHASHGMFGLPVRWEAVMLDAASITLGAWLTDRYLGQFTQAFRGAARARVVIAAYLVLLALWGLRPYVIETRVDIIAGKFVSEAFIPLAQLAERADVFSALHVGQQFLLYVPLGALLSVWPLRRHGRWSKLWPGIAAAVVIEVGHIFAMGRSVDMTNVLLAWAGLAMGWITTRRSGYGAYGAALREPTSRSSRHSSAARR